MLTPKTSADSWQEALRLINRCPVCNENYATDRAKVFAKNEVASLVHITCVSCRSNFVAMILSMGQGLSSVGMITDLDYEDAKRLNKTLPITIDETIEGYKFINNTKFSNYLI